MNHDLQLWLHCSVERAAEQCVSGTAGVEQRAGERDGFRSLPLTFTQPRGFCASSVRFRAQCVRTESVLCLYKATRITQGPCQSDRGGGAWRWSTFAVGSEGNRNQSTTAHLKLPNDNVRVCVCAYACVPAQGCWVCERRISGRWGHVQYYFTICN